MPHRGRRDLILITFANSVPAMVLLAKNIMDAAILGMDDETDALNVREGDGRAAEGLRDRDPLGDRRP